MMVFIDIEVSPQDNRVVDYGAVRDDGAVLHTQVEAEFNAFVEPCNEVCGHNIIDFDLKYLHLGRGHRYVDTLYVSPLLFPKKPYHRLVKDDKLLSDELNNPVNDARKAQDLLHDELAAWHDLSPALQEVYCGLLSGVKEFDGFMSHTGKRLGLFRKFGLVRLIEQEFAGRICANAPLTALIRKHPVELAYALSVVSTSDLQSLTPAWVLHNYPQVSGVLHQLVGSPCGDASCPYCSRYLDAHRGLRDIFGYEQFRTFDGEPMQQQAVEAAIRDESLLTIFPTGGGKSLTFQLPALMAGRSLHGLTVVISPLQSLMKDQVDNLSERGIGEAVAISGLLNPIERANAIQQVADGTANLLYIAPEMLRNRTVERLLMMRTVVRFVIDEAHCFSAWGQDFRVDYLYIGDFIRQLQAMKRLESPIPVSCFTATAKPKVVSDICDYFRQKLGVELKVFAAKATRSNLRYAVIHASTPDEKYVHLRNLILGHNCPTIVYVSRTKRTDELAAHLRADGVQALPFNGKMTAQDKVANQEAFMNDEAQVIVATSAFGMGVDKKDVGLVVHYDISDSLENYVQEAGRAGRDPAMSADCYVLYADDDLDKHFILLNQTKLSISEIQQVWKAIKDLTPQRPTVNLSPLDIARQAGWGEEVVDVETRVRAAISALEEAGFVKRGSNTANVFATGITVGNMDEASRRLAASPLFDEADREAAGRIIRALISSRSKTLDSIGESRVDYLSDILGLSRETVVRNVNLMRQEGLLADSRDMQAWVGRDAMRKLDAMLKLEQFLLKHIDENVVELNYKQLNEEASREGLRSCTVRTLRMIVRFLSLRGYIRREEHVMRDCVRVQLQATPQTTSRRFLRRESLCRFIVERLLAQVDKEAGLSNFSETELLKAYTANQSLFEADVAPSLADMDEALLYLSKTELIRLEGGFLVIYNSMQLKRLVERRTHFGKEQYRKFDEYYQQRIQQIHIVGEYANLMVRDYNAALQYVSDYFTLDYKQFISRYFKGERRTEISKNITAAKYKKFFGELSDRQREIIADKQSRYIVVAAGPGSGKTRVLVHKLASLLLLEDVKHEQLLMLTFSRAAATEFKTRLMGLVGNAAHFVDIKTFHSFGFDLLGRQGSLEEADTVVRRAAELIEQGGVEESKIAKSVLVIDEAQDMSADDFHLVRALMQHNEGMRVIAVGDDDQNIYHFRGSDSAHLKHLVTDYGATFYEMADNYRSDRAVVDYANHFVKQIHGRMKHTDIRAVSKEKGVVEEVATSFSSPLMPSTAVLTVTNEQALQVAHHLTQQGHHVRLVQSDDGFRFINLAEVRYFVKQLSLLAGKDATTISPEQWEQAKWRTANAYATSTCLPAVQHFFAEYESTHRSLYFSDLREFILESNIEDFLAAEDGTIYVSTIHKAKGREFDCVHLVTESNATPDQHMLRTFYVGITRARHALYIHPRLQLPSQSILLSLTMHDVWLGYFRDHKEEVLRLRSGDPLSYHNGYLISQQGSYIASLSAAMRTRIGQMEQNGYIVAYATVSHILAWRPRDERTEIAVCLANLCLQKQPPSSAPFSSIFNTSQQ